MNKKQRIEVYEKYNGHCAYCGKEIELKEMQVDHIIPKRDFIEGLKDSRVPDFLKHLTIYDVNHIDNLHPSCSVCNKWKSAFTLEFFRNEIYEQVKRLNAYSSNYRMAKRYSLVKEDLHPVIFYFEHE